MPWSRKWPEWLSRPNSESRSNEEGSVVEAAVVIPAAMLVVLVAVQSALWAHAEAIVQASASQGVRAASVAGGSLAAGRAEAQALLAHTGRQVVTQPSVVVEAMPGDTVHVHVAGTVEAILPWVHFQVSADRTGTRQEFRQSG